MAKQIIVIIGGPGSGKTTLINALSDRGFTCYPEVSREVTLEARRNGVHHLFLENPLLFSELLLEGRRKQFFAAVEDASDIVFLDRGIPDVLAYMNYIGDSFPHAFDAACREHIYHKIFVLPPWPEIYVSDDARYETYEQALLIYDHLVETYTRYGYELIGITKDTVQRRVEFLLEHIET